MPTEYQSIRKAIDTAAAYLISLLTCPVAAPPRLRFRALLRCPV
ncbi:MAG: hypothetical protein R3D26_09950 [Cyanobacteriota/Melainabacteria group bacterium]